LRTGWSKTTLGELTVGAINAQFMSAGGDPPEYSAAVRAAIDRGYDHASVRRVSVVHPQAGADLFT